MMARPILLAWLLLLGVAVAIGMWIGRASAPRPPSEAARTVTVLRGDLVAVVQATGQVDAARRATLSVPLGGRVAEVRVEVGDAVGAGTPLLVLDPSTWQPQVEGARAALAAAEAAQAQALTGANPGEIEAAQAQLRAAQLALSVAEAQRDRLPEATRETSPEAVAVEAARAEVEVARAALRLLVDGATSGERAALHAQVAQARATLAQAEAAGIAATLSAPFTGTVTARLVQLGEQVGPTQPLLALADLSTLFVAAEVDEVDVGRVAVGQPVTVTLDAFPTRPLPGTIERLSPAPSPERGATSFRATIHFNPADLPLRLGMAADVLIQAGATEGALLLPLRAIRYAETQPFVLVRRAGRPIEQAVTLGTQDEQVVEVLTGLVEGEVVEVP